MDKSILFQLDPSPPIFATDFQIRATKFDPSKKEEKFCPRYKQKPTKKK